MSKISKIILMCFILFWGFGCSTPKYLPSSNIKIISKDSLIIHTELVSTPIPVESHNIITPEKKSHLETSVAESDAEIDSLGMLHHTLVNKKDSLKTKIQYVDRIQYVDSVVIKEVPVEVEKPVAFIPKFYQFTFIFFWIVMLFLACKLYTKITIGKNR